jgi:hypothetical protein
MRTLFTRVTFLYHGTLYPGKHEPLITLGEFDALQKWLGRPGTAKSKRYSFPFTGIIRCGACGLMVTAEHKVNRYGSRYIYYHCTKRNTGVRCPEPSIEARHLEEQIHRHSLLRLLLIKICISGLLPKRSTLKRRAATRKLYGKAYRMPFKPLLSRKG